MSADNGIYILKTPKDGAEEEFEYRVIHAQGIDNIEDEDPAMVISYFGKCEALTKEEAQNKAFEMEEDCYILEYGISSIVLSHSFQWFREQATKSN